MSLMLYQTDAISVLSHITVIDNITLTLSCIYVVHTNYTAHETNSVISHIHSRRRPPSTPDQGGKLTEVKVPHVVV